MKSSVDEWAHCLSNFWQHCSFQKNFFSFAITFTNSGSLQWFFCDNPFGSLSQIGNIAITPSVLAEPTNEKSKASGILVRVIQCCFLFCFELEFELLSVAFGIPKRKVGNGFLLNPAGIYFRNAARIRKSFKVLSIRFLCSISEYWVICQ